MNTPLPEAKQAAKEAWDKYAPNRKPTWMRVIAEDKAFRIACNAADAATAKLREELDYILRLALAAQKQGGNLAAKDVVDEVIRMFSKQLAHQQPSEERIKDPKDFRLTGVKYKSIDDLVRTLPQEVQDEYWRLQQNAQPIAPDVERIALEVAYELFGEDEAKHEAINVLTKALAKVCEPLVKALVQIREMARAALTGTEE